MAIKIAIPNLMKITIAIFAIRLMPWTSNEEKGGIANPVVNRVLESCSDRYLFQSNEHKSALFDVNKKLSKIISQYKYELFGFNAMDSSIEVTELIRFSSADTTSLLK